MGAKVSEEMKRAKIWMLKDPTRRAYAAAHKYGLSPSAIYSSQWYKDLMEKRRVEG